MMCKCIVFGSWYEVKAQKIVTCLSAALHTAQKDNIFIYIGIDL